MSSFQRKKCFESYLLLVYLLLNKNKKIQDDHPVSKVKLMTIVEGDPKATFSIATTPRRRVVNALTHALLHSMYNLKASQMNVQFSLIQELMVYELKLDHNAAETTKTICYAKGEGAVDHSTVTR